MAYADYRLCDKCGGKAFYDATLDYQKPDAQHIGQWWLHGLGDWSVLCVECAKHWKCVIVPIRPA